MDPGLLRGRRSNHPGVSLDSGMISDFQSFLQVERQLSKRTVYSHCMYLSKLIEKTKRGEVGTDEIRGFMRGYMGASVSGYSNALKALRIFFRDYMRRGDLVEGFKFPATPFKPRTVPTRKELAEFYEEMPSIEGKLYFLLYASSGLRRKEALGLRPKDVNTEMKMVTPGKGVSGTKNTWVSFYGGGDGGDAKGV